MANQRGFYLCNLGLDLSLPTSSPIFIHISGLTSDCQLSKFSFFHLDLPLIGSSSNFHFFYLDLPLIASSSNFHFLYLDLPLIARQNTAQIILTNSIALIFYPSKNLVLILFKSIFLTFIFSSLFSLFPQCLILSAFFFIFLHFFAKCKYHAPTMQMRCHNWSYQCDMQALCPNMLLIDS